MADPATQKYVNGLVELRTASLQADQASLAERVLAIEERLGLARRDGGPCVPPPLAVVPSTRGDLADVAEPKLSTGTKSERICRKKLWTAAAEEESVFTMEESVWDTLLFVGAEGVPWHLSAMIVAGFVLNLIWQTSFCFIMAFSDSFVKDPFPSVGEVQKWRLTTAHDVATMDAVTSTSLAARVCNLDGSLSVSTAVKDMYKEIQEYLKDLGGSGMMAGPLLCGMVLALWVLFIMKELLQVVRFMSAVSQLPRGGGRSKILMDCASGRYYFAELGAQHLPFMAFCTALRAAIATLYGIFGGVWLSNTKNVETLVLNAAALCFLLDMDELIYQLLSPPAVQHLLRNLQPLKRKAVGKSFGLHVPVIAICSAAYIVVMMTSLVQPTVTKLFAMNTTLCEGNLDFVFGIRTHTGEVLMAETSTFSREVDRSSLTTNHRLLAVEEIVNASHYAHLRRSSVTGAARGLNEYLEETLAQTAHDWPTCEDVAFSNASFPFQDAVLRTLQPDPAFSCGDLKRFCTEPLAPLVRLLCPVECGCRSPRSGLFFNTLAGGCPRNKCVYMPEYFSQLETVPCEDPSPEELRHLAGWSAYWDQMAQVFADMRSVQHISGELRELAQRDGCAILNRTMAGISFVHFCHGDHLAGASLRPWCPVTCLCTRGTAECPSSCPETVPGGGHGDHGGHAAHGGAVDHGAGHTGGDAGTHSGHGSNASSHGSNASAMHSGHGSNDSAMGHGHGDAGMGQNSSGHGGHGGNASSMDHADSGMEHNSTGHGGATGDGSSGHGGAMGHGGHAGAMGSENSTGAMGDGSSGHGMGNGHSQNASAMDSGQGMDHNGTGHGAAMGGMDHGGGAMQNQSDGSGHGSGMQGMSGGR